MAQRFPEAEGRLLNKWICMKCSATHRGTKPPKSCRKCGYTGFRKKATERRSA
ncbi:MAG: 50S ribosomal protein L40e [Euryarchaeota archaeon]|nr:50S ribosomal protein L40e [Euryarchaeota archaeon]